MPQLVVSALLDPEAIELLPIPANRISATLASSAKPARTDNARH